MTNLLELYYRKYYTGNGMPSYEDAPVELLEWIENSLGFSLFAIHYAKRNILREIRRLIGPERIGKFLTKILKAV